MHFSETHFVAAAAADISGFFPLDLRSDLYSKFQASHKPGTEEDTWHCSSLTMARFDATEPKERKRRARARTGPIVLARTTNCRHHKAFIAEKIRPVWRSAVPTNFAIELLRQISRKVGALRPGYAAQAAAPQQQFRKAGIQPFGVSWLCANADALPAPDGAAARSRSRAVEPREAINKQRVLLGRQPLFQVCDMIVVM